MRQAPPTCHRAAQHVAERHDRRSEEDEAQREPTPAAGPRLVQPQREGERFRAR